MRAESWGLVEIPEEIFKKILAKVLVLSNNHISKIPRQLESLTGLRVLKLNGNQVSNSPCDHSGCRSCCSFFLVLCKGVSL